MGTRGYFEIGVFHVKRECNIGTLWRSAFQLGAAGIFTIGRRYDHQCSDTCKTFRHVPLRHFDNLAQFIDGLPLGAQLVGIEMGGTPLREFTHPERAIYLLGAEDHGLPELVLSKCQSVVSLEAVGMASYNVSVAGSIVLYHRCFLNGKS